MPAKSIRPVRVAIYSRVPSSGPSDHGEPRKWSCTLSRTAWAGRS